MSKRVRAILFVGLACCGNTPAAPMELNARFDLTQAECPLPASPALKARLVIGCLTPCSPGLRCNGRDGTCVAEGSEEAACPLEVAADADGVRVHGYCPNIRLSADAERVVALQWYVDSPRNGATVLIGEAVGAIPPRARSTTPDLQITFGPSSENPNGQAIKTKAADSEPRSERDRFNCDRSGVHTCEGEGVANTSETDSCSNLEELCRGTLFQAMAVNDVCTP